MPDRKPEFPTPWRVERFAGDDWFSIFDANGDRLRFMIPVHGERNLNALRRIVAAVNAAEGRDG